MLDDSDSCGALSLTEPCGGSATLAHVVVGSIPLIVNEVCFEIVAMAGSTGGSVASAATEAFADVFRSVDGVDAWVMSGNTEAYVRIGTLSRRQFEFFAFAETFVCVLLAGSMDPIQLPSNELILACLDVALTILCEDLLKRGSCLIITFRCGLITRGDYSNTQTR